jgi:ABC-type transport system involved in multi-copper enzyme maturation permease subunit
MIALIRVELLKLRTVRLSYGLLAAAIGLTAVFCVIEAVRAGTNALPPLSTAAGVTDVITGGVWSMMFAAILGATLSSGEFRHATATGTYLVTPARNRVLAAKTVAAAAGGAIFGLLGWAVATGVGLGFAAARGYADPLTAATIARYAAGHVVAAALLGAIGAGLGSLIRSQLAVVIGILVWSIVVESVLGGLFSAVQPYLPYTAATTLSGTPLGGGAFGPAHDAATSASPLPFAGATALVAAVTVAVAVLAARTTVRRDVS